MKKKQIRKFLPFLGFVTINTVVFAQNSEEQKLVQIAQKLKPISDSAWNEIAGSHSAETYEIQKGDTLWEVSKRLFGNSYYWPKVWSINSTITNPHIVTPGEKLAFIPGTSNSLPQLTTEAQYASAVSSRETTVKRNHEYEKVEPTKWAPTAYAAKTAEKYDEYGLDKNLKLQIESHFNFRLPVFANDATIPYLGEIIGSRRDGVGLSQGDTVFIKSSSQDLQVGATYSVLSEPEFIRETKSDRTGYIYRTAGEIKIIGVKDENYIGTISAAYDVLRRGDRLYPQLPQINDIKPIAASSAMEALVTFNKEANTHNTAQSRFIHFDRGIEDGVQIGNVFRIYDYFDPQTGKKLTDNDILVNANAVVVHTTAQYSTALVISSRDVFTRGSFGVLLTDISDLERLSADRTRDIEDGEQVEKSPEDRELDELDRLDKASGDSIGKKEETEIKELDHWDRTKGEPPAEPEKLEVPETPADKAELPPSNEPAPSEVAPTSPDAELDSGVMNPGENGGEALPNPDMPSDIVSPPSGAGGVNPSPPAITEPAPTVEPVNPAATPNSPTLDELELAPTE